MAHETKIKKALVVLSPDLISPDKPMQSPLVRRAVSLAKITGCELELFHVCFDGSLEDRLFASKNDLQYERDRLLDSDATKLAEMATRLKSECVNVQHEVRWDHPRTDAILRKVAQSKPDIVLKQGREHSYLLGLTSNTDWELARRSPSHVWFVNEDVEDVDRILAAVGNKFGDPSDITTATDYDLLRVAGVLGNIFNAEIYPVNAYQVPYTNTHSTNTGEMLAPVQASEKQRVIRAQMVKEHSAAVKALAQYFSIATDNVHICEGNPNKVIPEIAESVDADMIVMGSNGIGRLERFMTSVTVEPVMSYSDCDVLVVRERDYSSVPELEKNPRYGIPQYDLEHAIINPEDTFASPQKVANLSGISAELRNRILQAWEYDIRSEMKQENEGGPAGDIDYKALDEILVAKAQLRMAREKPGKERPKLNRMTA